MQLRPEGQGQCDRPQVDHPPEDPGRFTIGDEFGCPGFNTDNFLRFFGVSTRAHRTSRILSAPGHSHGTWNRSAPVVDLASTAQRRDLNPR